MPPLLILALVVFVLLYATAQLGLAWKLQRVPADVAVPPPGSAEAPSTASSHLAFRPSSLVPQPLPLVAVLVAARNEEANLRRCLTALAALDYPPDRLTVLIADDNSTDATAHLLADFVRDRPTWRVLTITERLGAAKGKANALAHLIAVTDVELLLCCDADIAVPPTWARALVAEAQHTNAALVVGTTLIEGASTLARAQCLDWLRALAVLRVATAAGRPFTGMGNNQLLRRSAYYATGGYETLPFSVTEDFQLFQELTRLGFRTAHVFGPGALAWSAPVESWSTLVRQRRRWLRGLLAGLTPRLAAAATVEALVFPALLALVFGGAVGWGLGAWGAKILATAGLLRVARRRLSLPSIGALEILRYEGYVVLLALVLPVAAMWPGKVRWKGREL